VQRRDAENDPEPAALLRTYGLPPGWTAPECFTDVASVDGIDSSSIQLAGFVARRRSDQTEVTGSAGALDRLPLARAKPVPCAETTIARTAPG
jgi:hypothetical protein